MRIAADTNVLVRFRGTTRVGWAFTFATAAYNLIRLPKLLATAP